MDVEEQIKKRVRESGTRVEERLSLLELLLAEDGVSAVQDRLRAAEERLTDAMDRLRREAMGR
jgi:hypothetical protein